MWTANLRKISRDYFNAKAIINFTDGTTILTQEYTVLSSSDLVNSVTSQLNILNNVDTLIATTPNGPIAPTVVTPVDPALTTFLGTLRTRYRMLNAINLGIKTAADADVVQNLADLRAQFQPGFLTSL